ncbi:hypothetical protein B7P34_06285 [Streptosporangium nondiastaticum]|uniref:HTH luxR-type domain-containing protein n=1 Tax=Streptosporangium nondiastaticum TaxID=35764 RepID=A0A9X7PJ07_9ACTN|nr:hypothetical protein B7P34_06285 [Streptosporangium nondiastaticum]
MAELVLVRDPCPSRAIFSNVPDRARQDRRHRRGPQPYFNPRERDVIELLPEGLSNRQIADKLGISFRESARCGAGAEVGAFALAAEQDEHLDGRGVGAVEPVWHMGVELGGLAFAEDQVLVTEE